MLWRLNEALKAITNTINIFVSSTDKTNYFINVWSNKSIIFRAKKDWIQTTNTEVYYTTLIYVFTLITHVQIY